MLLGGEQTRVWNTRVMVCKCSYNVWLFFWRGLFPPVLWSVTLFHCLTPNISELCLLSNVSWAGRVCLPQVPEMLKKTQGVGPIRKVMLVKDDHEGLGISITVRSIYLSNMWDYLFSACTGKLGHHLDSLEEKHNPTFKLTNRKHLSIHPSTHPTFCTCSIHTWLLGLCWRPSQRSRGERWLHPG